MRSKCLLSRIKIKKSAGFECAHIRGFPDLDGSDILMGVRALGPVWRVYRCGWSGAHQHGSAA